MKLLSNAKINLFLHVGPKRGDGYHEIFSLMAPISLHDLIEIQDLDEKVCKIEMQTASHFSENQKKCLDIPDTENLIYKAWDIFPFSEKKGITVKIKKNIPPGGGLGGGSSNAACILTYLNNKLDTPFPLQQLTELASCLGSDVPFFIYNKPMLASGRGEILEAFDIEIPIYVLTITPDFTISTKWAYSNVKIDLTLSRKQNILCKLSSLKLSKLIEEFDNAFRPLLEKKNTFYTEMRNMFLENGAVLALPSGSGSSFFAVFLDKEKALKVAKENNVSVVSEITN